MLVRSLDAVCRTLTFTSPTLTTAPMRHILCRSSWGRMSGYSKLLDWPLTNYFWLLLTFCERDMCQQLLWGYFWHRGSEQTHKWFPWEDHMFHSQTRSSPLSGTLLNFGPSQAEFIVAPLCLARLSWDGMNPPQTAQLGSLSRIPVPSGPAEVRPGHNQLLVPLRGPGAR